ncbi:ABC transporter permease [uncultured Phenylobacterium sp.]|uniref:ABC transporter permease n=1 Tax=uncultured Phenylobacterium sp. TaxID=349273 RepID=UPI0025DA4600|nr:ABC transporter permease [uncultured Phenylobacterium sp.]
MTGMFASIAWRNLWRNPRRTLITLVVVAVGVWSILTFDVMLKAFGTSSRETSLRLLTGEAQIHAPGYLEDPSVARRMPTPGGSLLGALDSPLVDAWAPRVRVPAIVQSEYRTRSITLLGVSPARERTVSDMPAQVVAGRYLSSDTDPGIVIGQHLAEKLKTRIGKRLIILVQSSDGRLAETSFTIVGLFGGTQGAQDEYAFTSLRAAQGILGVGNDVSEISLFGADDANLDGVVSALKSAAPALDIQPWTTLSPMAYTIETFSQTYVGIWLMIMFVLMAIGIVNTQLMAVFERTREFGLLQALGMRPGLIVLQVTLESAMLIGIGILVGIVLMLLTVVPLLGGLDTGFLAQGMELIGMGQILYPRIDPAAAAGSCLVVWVLGIGAALWPARAAANVDPVVAMAEL